MLDSQHVISFFGEALFLCSESVHYTNNLEKTAWTESVFAHEMCRNRRDPSRIVFQTKTSSKNLPKGVAQGE